MKPAAFQGSYSDLRFVRTRSVAVISVEIPIEQASAFVAAFGAPTPGAEVPVAIARLAPEKAASEPPRVAAAPKERRPFRTLSLAQQAGIRCGEISFAAFLEDRFSSRDDPADFVRHYCGVDTRAELDIDDTAGKAWLTLCREYEVWLMESEHV